MNTMEAAYPIDNIPCATGEVSLTQRLVNEKVKLEQRLSDIGRAIEILEKNPTLAELHNILVRLRWS